MKTKNQFKNFALITLALAFATAPVLHIPTVHAQTTTTKYLNGKIAFNSYQGTGEIYTMDPNGSNATNVTNNPANDYGSAWMPDGSKIGFGSARNGQTEIYTMNPDGSSPVRLTNNSLEEGNIAWSPDGSKIAFTQYNNNYNIYTMDADGSNVATLTGGSSNRSPAWSPDGSKILFDSDRDGNTEVYIMNADGSGQTRLTNNSDSDYVASFSPDGSKIVFISWRNDNNAEVYTMDANGSNVARITNTSAEEDSASYSPDGTKFLMTVYPDSNYDLSNVYTTDIDGSNRMQLTNVSNGQYNDVYGPQSWQPLPYQVTTNDNGTTTSTIPANASYPTTDYTVQANETLILDGTLCDVTVQSGGTVMGTGSIAPGCTLTVEPGGIVAPGHSPGCLASGNLVLSGTYQAQIAGTTACSQYDQLQVTGTVNLTGSTLTTTLLNNFTPTAGTSFTLIANDATDPVTGTFANLPEGATITVAGMVFKVSYIGGSGNDVTLTAQSVPGVPNTGSQSMNTTWLPLLLSILLVTGSLFIVKKYKKGIVK